MNSKQLFLVISQLVGISLRGESGAEAVAECGRDVSILVARNSGDNISHLTIEYRGVRAKHLVFVMFDGTGDMGIGLGSVVLPKQKINMTQKAVLAKCVFQFLMAEGIISASYPFLSERVDADYGIGVAAVHNLYDNCVTQANRRLGIQA